MLCRSVLSNPGLVSKNTLKTTIQEYWNMGISYLNKSILLIIGKTNYR